MGEAVQKVSGRVCVGGEVRVEGEKRMGRKGWEGARHREGLVIERLEHFTKRWPFFASHPHHPSLLQPFPPSSLYYLISLHILSLSLSLSPLRDADGVER